MKRLSFLTLLFFVSLAVVGQKQASRWFFGAAAGLDFNSGTAVVDPNGKMNASEGCSVASDRVTGALKFYTNGANAWGTNHTIMPNGSGLGGNMSSAQSTVIVPVPCSDSLYYIFTTDANENGFTNGLQYSMVDMSLNGGNGDVMAGVKNVPLITPACEKLAAVHAANGIDFWVLTIEQSTNNYYAYKVDANGVQPPVVTTIGHTYTGSSGPRAYLKFSPDGSKVFSVVGWSTANAELYDFDNSTGVLSNPIILNRELYGASFSSNSKLLYTANSTDIFQYDLSSGNPATIQASRTQIGTVSAPLTGLVRALQLGIDGKIYLADFAEQYLHTIDNPNVVGTGANFNDSSVFIGKTIMLGLPNFVESYFDSAYSYIPCSLLATTTSTNSQCKTPCTGTASANPLGGTPPYTYSWATTPAQTTQTISNLCPGTYTVTITDSLNVSSTATVTVAQTPPPTVTPGAPFSITCTTTSGNLTATSNSVVTYNWAGPGVVSGGTTGSPTVNAGGTYTVTVTDTATGCTNTATVTVPVDTVPPNVTTTGFVLNCINTSGTINATSTTTGATYNWSGPGIVSGGTSGSPTINAAGTYTVTVTDPNNGCTNSGTATVVSAPPPVATVSPDITITPGDTTTLTASGGTSYTWGPTDSLSCVNCSSTVANPTETTIYCVFVTDSSGCYDTACVRVEVKELCFNYKDEPIPNVFSPNNDGSNDYFYLDGLYNWNECVESFHMIIYDRWGKRVYESDDKTFAWAGNTINGKNASDGTYFYVIDLLNGNGEQERLSGFISLVR